MRGLIFKTKGFKSLDLERSNRPTEIIGKQDFDKDQKDFKQNTICVWICVEKDDKKSYIDELVERINYLNKQFYNLQEIIILPFGHLSRNLAHPDLSVKLINNLVTKLEKELKVHKMSFGTHKEVGFNIAGHPGGISYFEFPYSGKKPKVG